MELEVAESSGTGLREESVGVRLWSFIAEIGGLPFFRKLTSQIHKVIDKVTQ